MTGLKTIRMLRKEQLPEGIFNSLKTALFNFKKILAYHRRGLPYLIAGLLFGWAVTRSVFTIPKHLTYELTGYCPTCERGDLRK